MEINTLKLELVSGSQGTQSMYIERTGDELILETEGEFHLYIHDIDTFIEQLKRLSQHE